MRIPIFQVDAFAERAFEGNPAAVCLLESPAEPEWMQKLAAEMNLSETAFLYPEGAEYGLRWFTPVQEVALCGHATLASAHVLYETGRLKPEEVARFTTASGVLEARKSGKLIELDFPAVGVKATARDAALGVEPLFVGKAGEDLLVEVEAEAVVRGVAPDFAALKKLPVRGVIVTSRSEAGRYDFVSRFFAPACGIDEDPVTGSAHCALGPFWGERLGKKELVGYQASKRGGVVEVAVKGERVLLGGRAVTVLSGHLAAAAGYDTGAR